MAVEPVTMAYRVPYADTDQMGVVYYANYLVLFERARNEMLRAYGLTYRELEQLGVALPVVEASVEYHSPSHYDDLLEISAVCSEYKGVRIKVSCQVRRDGKLLAEGFTRHVFADMKTLRPVRPSAEILTRLRLV